MVSPGNPHSSHLDFEGFALADIGRAEVELRAIQHREATEADATPPTLRPGWYRKTQARTMVGSALAKRDCAGSALAQLIERIVDPQAAALDILDAAERKIADSVPPSDLLTQPRQPAAAAGHNLTHRIVPSPRPPGA